MNDQPDSQLSTVNSPLIPPGYKLTEVGVIPEEWETYLLPDVSWFQEGPGLRQWQFTIRGIKVINITNLEDGYLNLDRTDRHISKEELDRTYKHFLIDKGDIVVASSGNSYCKVAVVRDQDLPLVMNTSVIRFKPRELLDYRYLLIFLNSPWFKEQIDLLITGGAQPNFGPFHLKKIRIQRPPLSEQRAIAASLSDVDALLAKIDQLIAKKRDLKLATMQQLLTGKTRLPGFEPTVGADSKPNAVELSAEVGRNKSAPADVSGKTTGQVPETVVARPYSGLQPNLNSTVLGSKPSLSNPAQTEPAPNQPGTSAITGLARAGLEPAPTLPDESTRAGLEPAPTIPDGWEVKRLGDVSPLQRGFDLPSSQLQKGRYPVVYSNGVSDFHAHFMVKGPGVVTGRSGTIGNVHFIEEDFWPHNTSLWVTSFKGNSPRFIFFLLSHIGLEKFGTGSGVPTLNRNDVHTHKILIPSKIEEQTAIATVLSDMDAEITALEARRDKTRDIKQGMMQELLTGQIRLV
ncbi:MAG: restriction endonuclease subunit S [Proteobacteria bacterium]|nr:restriction endonuclease subunit S [Pseudomonadota bacterium]